MITSRLLIGFALATATACARAPEVTVPAQTPSAATLTELGRAVFFDSTLSASGHMSCATCHDPAHGWSAPNARSVQLGGLDGGRPGMRAVPTLGYAQDTPPFTEHFREDEGNDSEDQGPAGGRMWDGRAQSAQDQAALPLLSTFEMANVNRASALARLRASPSAKQFRAAFGDRVFDDSTAAWNGLLSALDVFQQRPEDFYPYSSKYDAFLRGTTTLTSQEQRGLALFNSSTKGNCASCHPSGVVRGAFPQFTDRGFIALGVPRNNRIPANADTAYFDLGLCGPARTDLAGHENYCGLFKTPTLRNVARRGAFFHNGAFTSLEEVLRFYAERDVHPEKFYRTDQLGVVRSYDDLPTKYVGHVNVDAPFDRKPGQRAAFSDAEAADIIAFLRTLNDGFVARP
ncbi:MAG: cytochrome c peroxidase [Gemmatimonas sp.]